jgi:hypothetical protein
MTSIGLSAITATHVTISADEPAGSVPAGAGDVRDDLVVITDVDAEHTPRPVAVADRRGLTLPGAEMGPLRDLVPRLPPLVTVEIGGDSVDEQTLLVIADTLSQLPEVPGVLLERSERPFAAISRTKVAAALPLSLLSKDELRGEPPTATATQGALYVCRKCVPNSVHIPLADSQEAPFCRKVWFHGPMTPGG